jgi:molybdopterin/thiamine biosynthesis adenylyltransferase
VVAANIQDRSDTADIEIDQGEPLAIFYSTLPNAAFLIDGHWQIPASIGAGWLRIGFRQHVTSPKIGAILRVEDCDHALVCSLPDQLAGQFSRKVWGRWTRVTDFVYENDPEKFRAHIETVHSFVRRPYWAHVGEEAFDIIGVIYPEEVRRRENADGWIFSRKTGRLKKRDIGFPKVEQTGQALVKAQRSGLEDFQTRNSVAATLAAKKVAVFGLGCVGGPLALELAKLGSSLILIDPDEVELAPTIRWPLGFEYLGWNKAKAFRHFIAKQWPYSNIEARDIRAGSEYETDQEIIRQADLVIDATAEIGVQRYLNDFCTALGKPLIIISTTPGGWGGRIALFGPSRAHDPCRTCLWHYEQDGTVAEPPSDPNGTFQPQGCGDITFYACSSDTAEISLAGARLAISTLSDGTTGIYPKISWNIGTLFLRSSEGDLIGPKLKGLSLPPHPACPNHGTSS